MSAVSSNSLSPWNKFLDAYYNDAAPRSVTTEVSQTNTAVAIAQARVDSVTMAFAAFGYAGQEGYEWAKQSISLAVKRNEPRPSWFDLFEDVQVSFQKVERAMERYVAARVWRVQHPLEASSHKSIEHMERPELARYQELKQDLRQALTRFHDWFQRQGEDPLLRPFAFMGNLLEFNQAGHEHPVLVVRTVPELVPTALAPRNSEMKTPTKQKQKTVGQWKAFLLNLLYFGT